MEGDGVQGAGPAATHGEYCGSTAHVITTCPVAASEVEEEAQDVVITMPGAPVALPAGFVTSASDAIGHLEDELQSQTALRREQDKLAAGSAAAARPPSRPRAGQQANPDIPTVNAMAAAGSGHAVTAPGPTIL